jgi:hypothetical protein
MPDKALTSLSHHIDIVWLKEAFRRTRKDGAAGVDGQTAAEYETQLKSNLRSLLDRAKSGTYRAPPVRRAHIPKGSGSETRPIGIPTFEDKVLQRAVVMALEPVYEQDFFCCSYGFRPGRDARRIPTDRRDGSALEIRVRLSTAEALRCHHKHLRSSSERSVGDPDPSEEHMRCILKYDTPEEITKYCDE